MIECVVNFAELAASHPMLADAFILAKLRDAGIPVRGVFFFQGLNSGRLDQTPLAGGEMKFVWSEA